MLRKHVLCNRCHKKISSGEKVKIIKDKVFLHWLSWRRPLRRGGVFCPPCYKKEIKRRKRFWKEYFWFFTFVIFCLVKIVWWIN